MSRPSNKPVKTFSMENFTYNSPVLQLEGLVVPQDLVVPTFMVFLLCYVMILVTNVGLVLLISLEPSLHQPMYLLFCNLPLNDVLGNTVVVPRLLSDMLRPASQRLIGYPECVVQAFYVHLYAAASHTILMVMAFDRYVAICRPLHYGTVMTNRTVFKLSASAWGLTVFLVIVLLSLTVRLNRCETLLTNPFCDNATLFKLACENAVVNNIYGLAYTMVLLGSSMGCIVLTYTKIASVCAISKSKTLNSKALKTCSTHLAAYLLMFVSGLMWTVLHRFPVFSSYRKLSALFFHILPGVMNPVIYALQSSEIKLLLLKMLRLNKAQ